MHLYLIRIILSQSFWNWKHLFVLEIVKSYIFFVYIGGNTPPVGTEKTPPNENFFIVGIFGKNTSIYAKLMGELYICDNLNQIYRFFFIFNNNKKKWKESLEATLYYLIMKIHLFVWELWFPISLTNRSFRF